MLRAATAPEGLVASAALPHYAAVWTRDVAFAALGANLSPDPELNAAVGRSLAGLARLQAASGEIPNAWWPGRASHSSGSSIWQRGWRNGQRG